MIVYIRNNLQITYVSSNINPQAKRSYCCLIAELEAADQLEKGRDQTTVKSTVKLENVFHKCTVEQCGACTRFFGKHFFVRGVKESPVMRHIAANH